VIALGATAGNTGIVSIPGPTGIGAFAVATFNVGAPAALTATADTGAAALPIALSICQTDPGSGTCLAPPSGSVGATFGTNATPTFAVFAAGSGTVPFDPAVNRIFFRLKDGGGATRGSTSVAVQTQ
jgi:hypothetical protein